MIDLHEVKNNKLRLPIKSLDLWKRNPRVITREAVDKAKIKLLQHFESEPLIVDGREDHLPTSEGKPNTYTVISGNARLIAIRELINENKWPEINGQRDLVYVEVRNFKNDAEAIDLAFVKNGSFGEQDDIKAAELVTEYLVESEIELDSTPYTLNGKRGTLMDLVDSVSPSKEEEVDPTKEPREKKEVVCPNCNERFIP